MKRKIGAGAGLIFKGSGFYITDYRSEGYKKSKKRLDQEQRKLVGHGHKIGLRQIRFRQTGAETRGKDRFVI